jgi:hypothetical protein
VSTSIRGACLCGAVAFTIAPPYRWFAHCHCSMCRKHYGSLFGTSLGVARAAFCWLEGTSEIVHYRATAAFERPFCRQCGSTLPGASEEEGYLNVPAGLLDDNPGARPRSNIFVASRSALTTLDDALPRHDAYAQDTELPTWPNRAPLEGATVSGSCLCGAAAFAALEMPRRRELLLLAVPPQSSGSVQQHAARCARRVRLASRPGTCSKLFATAAEGIHDGFLWGLRQPDAERGRERRAGHAAGRRDRHAAAAASGRAPLRRLESAVVRDHGRVAAIRRDAAAGTAH